MFNPLGLAIVAGTGIAYAVWQLWKQSDAEQTQTALQGNAQGQYGGMPQLPATTTLVEGRIVTPQINSVCSAGDAIDQIKDQINSANELIKTLIENDKLIIQDYTTIQEMFRFIHKGTSFEAEEGNDDTVMCCVLFSWMTDQLYFRELTS